MSESGNCVTFTKFIENKVRIWFKMNDMKKCGSIGNEDYTAMAELFKNELNLPEDRAKELRHWLLNGWDILVEEGIALQKAGKPGGLGSDVTPALIELNQQMKKGGKVTEDEYILAYKELVETNKMLFVKTFEKMVGNFFDAFDANSDGYVDANDLIRGWKCFGIDLPDAVRMIFSEMDTKQCGKIDKATYVGHWVEFMVGNEPNAPIAKFLCKV